MSTMVKGARYHCPGMAPGWGEAFAEGRFMVTEALTLIVMRLVPRDTAVVPEVVIGSTASCGIVCHPSDGPSQTLSYCRKVPPWSRSDWEPISFPFLRSRADGTFACIGSVELLRHLRGDPDLFG